MCSITVNLSNSLAPMMKTDQAYAVGDVAVYRGIRYVCTVAIPEGGEPGGQFNPDHWKKESVEEVLSRGGGGRAPIQEADVPENYDTDDLREKINKILAWARRSIALCVALPVIGGLIGNAYAADDVRVQKAQFRTVMANDYVVTNVDLSGVATASITNGLASTNYVNEAVSRVGGVTHEEVTNVAEKVTRAVKPVRLGEYLWEIGTEGEDWVKATNRLAKVYPSYGACTGVKAGKLHGRNLDWYYGKESYFIVRSPARDGKYGVIGMAGGNAVLTDAFVESGKWSDAYYSLPFSIVDGMNDKGVVIQSNVVQKDPASPWRVKRPGCIITFAIIRYALDRCSSALEAAELINSRVFIPSEFKYDSHYLVSDKNESYIVEDGYIYSSRDCPADVITNFRVGTVVFNDDKTIDWNTVETYGVGLERYELVRTSGRDSSTLDGMIETMKSLWYTKSYDITTSPFWYTEYCGPESETGYPGLTVENAKSDPSVFQAVIQRDRERFIDEHDSDSVNYRGGQTWHTVHTAIYDQDNLTMTLFTQEDEKSRRVIRMNEYAGYVTGSDVEDMLLNSTNFVYVVTSNIIDHVTSNVVSYVVTNVIDHVTSNVVSYVMTNVVVQLTSNVVNHVTSNIIYNVVGGETATYNKIGLYATNELPQTIELSKDMPLYMFTDLSITNISNLGFTQTGCERDGLYNWDLYLTSDKSIKWSTFAPGVIYIGTDRTYNPQHEYALIDDKRTVFVFRVRLIKNGDEETWQIGYEFSYLAGE